MDKMKWKTYAFWVFFSEAVGAISGILSREGVAVYQAVAVKPALSPPGWLFPVVWGILFALMGIGAARISLLTGSSGRSMALNLFVAQLIINFFWPLLFFNAWAFGFALFWLLLLWTLVLVMVRSFWRLDKTAAWLQVPYLVWLTFAAYLNTAVWILNQ